MKVKDLIKLLSEYPENMPVKLMPNHERGADFNYTVNEFTEENMLISSEKAWVDDEAPYDTWDCEDGKIRHKGRRYLLINPIIT
ncbi:hypothetical protein ACFS6H_19935 [Terrimonas rubra]|uniref:Uncharacterized protein n=1 Tax=Terrimonas rubra TaxID=1035890 RepID=A0ABW6ABB0_9BACT